MKDMDEMKFIQAPILLTKFDFELYEHLKSNAYNIKFNIPEVTIEEMNKILAED